MRSIIISLLIGCALNLTAQFSNFDRGFKVGFERGYCYSSSPQSTFICNPPIAPFAPLPRYPESMDSWSDGYNRGFIIGMSKRSKIDNKGSSEYPYADIPSFNSYVPQNPLSLMSLDQINYLASAYALRRQQQVEALGGLLEALFTPRPLSSEQNFRNQLKREQAERERFQKEQEKHERKESRRLIIGSSKYNRYKKNNKTYLVLSGILGLAGCYAYSQAHKLSSRYVTATSDATSIRRMGNLMYQASPFLLVGSGFCLVKYFSIKSKIRNARAYN